MNQLSKAEWIAADWGTTNLRIWALETSGKVLAHKSSAKGMGQLTPDAFEPALLELAGDVLAPDRRTPVIVCGMAGSRQGWLEAPYLETPCPPPSLKHAVTVPNTDSRLDVRILPGIKQISPADVMRGEETQIAGFLVDNPGHTGTLCLPGTHAKWVGLEEGTIKHFRTCMTGEVFALLSKQSVLRHSLPEQSMDEDAFCDAVREITSGPSRLPAELFGIRAAGLVGEQSPAAALGRLSGLLIGAEIAAVSNLFDLSETTLLGGDKIAGAYADALAALGYKPRIADADQTTLAGLKLAYHSYRKEFS